MTGQQAKGTKLKLGKYSIRVWKTGWEFDDGTKGRVYFFYWHRLSWFRKKFIKK